MESAEEGECTAERRIGGEKGTIKKKNVEDEDGENMRMVGDNDDDRLQAQSCPRELPE